MPDDIKPYIPASRTIAELTVRAIVLGLVLSVVMCAANIYVGLYAGMTVSAAIPASVISMGVLRGLFRTGTILENNVVHTIASSGESLSAGIIFTVPALVLLGVWSDFGYWETTLIAMAGGVLGVVMMIPLRRPMIIEQKELKFPEGVACAEVLKAGDRGGQDMLSVFWALVVGGLFKSLIAVVGLFRGSVERGWQVGKTGFYVGSDMTPMMMGVGFIVGWEISLLVFLGGAISFIGAIPILAAGADFAAAPATDVLLDVWDTKIRFFGIGAMVVAGIYSIVKIAASMGAALRTALRGIRHREDTAALERTERGISGRTLLALLVFSIMLIGIAYYQMTGDGLTTAITTVAMFVLSFFFVAVASYIVGLVGSSNSPVSGMIICTVLLTAGLLLVLGYTGEAGMLATLGVAGVVCCAACTSGDICQDLKIGQIVGATPRALQTGEVIGAIVPAFVIAPVMQLLQHAYGIGKPAREGIEALKAPQAVMFEKLVGGIFEAGRDLEWDLIAYGALVGVVAILIDRLVLQPRDTKFRLHPMPLAVGMYLPWTVTVPILVGGLVYRRVERRSLARGDSDATRQSIVHRGLLFASGLVAGEAIMGIAVAALVMTNFEMPLLSKWLERGWEVDALSLAAFAFVTYLLFRRAEGARMKGGGG